MSKYRIDFVTHADRVFHSAEIEARDDEDARRYAKQLRSGIGKGYRILNNNRLIHTEVY